MEELSVECTSMSLRLRSRLYATIGGCGKMSRVCWSVDKMQKFSSKCRLMWVLNGWYVMTRGTQSTVVSPRFDLLEHQDGRWLLPYVDPVQVQ